MEGEPQRKIRRECECGSDPSPCFAQEDVSGGSVWLEVDDRLGFYLHSQPD